MASLHMLINPIRKQPFHCNFSQSKKRKSSAALACNLTLATLHKKRKLCDKQATNCDLETLAEVAAQEWRRCDSREKLKTIAENGIDDIEYIPAKLRGTAWTFDDNLKLWQAYVDWKQSPNRPDIVAWKRRHSNNRNFAFYAQKNFFKNSRSVTAVRKHFFKLKSKKFGETFRSFEQAKRLALSEATCSTLGQVGTDSASASSGSTAVDNDEDLSNTTDESMHLQIASNNAALRVEQRRQAFSLLAKSSNEVLYRRIAEQAQRKALQ